MNIYRARVKYIQLDTEHYFPERDDSYSFHREKYEMVGQTIYVEQYSNNLFHHSDSGNYFYIGWLEFVSFVRNDDDDIPF